MSTYREDMRRAWDRINSFPTQRLETRLGTIEYADQGDGSPLLVSHGVLGCHVDTVGSWWADLSGPAFRVIGPSRFGYFGSTLPKEATPADQADGYALLLDHVGDRFRADRIRRALESTIREGKVLTRDLGGSATTKEFTDAVISHLA